MKNLKIIGSAILILIIAVLGVRFLSGPEDDWLCQNGEWVGHGQPSAPKPTVGCGDQNQADKSDLIVVDSPKPGDRVTSPLIINGKARGTWFFEASFPVELLDKDGGVIAQATAQAESDWMTADFVPFTARLDFKDNYAGQAGTLVLKRDNPSGLPEYDDKIEIPVRLGQAENMAVKVFFNSKNIDNELICETVMPVVRQVIKTPAPARAALEELLKGPTADEIAAGYFTSINSGVKIRKLTINKGTAMVDFDETMEKDLGGSCRVSAIRAEIIQTLKQFSAVKDVVISVNGRTEDILQP